MTFKVYLEPSPLIYLLPTSSPMQGRMELGLIFRRQMTKETILLRPYSIIQAEVCKVYVCDCISKICLLFLNHWFQFSKSQPLPLMWLSFNYNVSSLLLICLRQLTFKSVYKLVRQKWLFFNTFSNKICLEKSM